MGRVKSGVCMARMVQRWFELLEDEGGQSSLEYAMLLMASAVVGFLLLMAMGQVVNGLYGGAETEIAKPSHH